MGELKNRQRYTTSIENEVVEKFKEVSERTRIPQSKLVEEAMKYIIKKYGKPDK